MPEEKKIGIRDIVPNNIRDNVPNNIRDNVPNTKNSYFQMSSTMSLIPKKKKSLIPNSVGNKPPAVQPDNIRGRADIHYLNIIVVTTVCHFLLLNEHYIPIINIKYIIMI